jgi:AsmA protein
MKRPRIRRRCLLPLGFLVIPPLFWGAVLAVTPTEWARTRIVAGLSRATGRDVQLGSLRLGALGGIHLNGLRIGAPGSADDPWLKADATRINVSLLQLLAGQLEPTEIRVDGLTLRVLRKQDGTLELADLVEPRRDPRPDAAADPSTDAPAIEVRVRNAQITIIDEPSGTRLDLTEVEGLATAQEQVAVIQDWHGLVNGGRFELAASLDRSGSVPGFEGRLRAQGVELGQGTGALAYVVPVVSELGAQGSVEGRMDVSLYVRGAGRTHDAVQRSLVGQGTLRLDPVEFDRSRFLAELTRLIELPTSATTGSLKSDFTIQDRRVSTSDLTVVLGNLPIVLAGWTDFDGRLDYRVRTDGLTDRLPGKAREFLAEMAIDAGDLADFRIEGTLDRMDVTSQTTLPPTLGAGTPPIRQTLDRNRLRELGRQVRDRVLR